jgi:HPt (histidine-containing phosphotransfer) domain-containing protein
MADAPAIDPQAIENLRALNPDDGDEFSREIVTIYLEDTPLRIAELEHCLAAGDVPKFTRAAHSVKGSSANLGATAVRAAAEKLEHHSNKHGLENVVEMIASLKTEFARAQTELTKLLQPR